MTPSTYIKAQGLPSLAYVAREVGKPVQTLQNWYRDNFALFEAVVAGVVASYQLKKELPSNPVDGQTAETSQGRYIFNERERE